MNFVSHRHLAERDLGSAEGALGAMLPDLWRMADRRQRPRRADSTTVGDDGDLAELERGLRHHLALDAWFHRRPIFLDGQAATGRALGNLDAPRLRLFAHVAWELCLDGALMRRLTVEKAVADMRRTVRAATPERHRRLMRRHRPDAPREELDVAIRRLEDLFDSLHRGDWIAGYATGDGLVARLDGVRRRFAFEPLQDPVRRRAADAFETLLELAEDRLDELVDGSRGVAGLHRSSAER